MEASAPSARALRDLRCAPGVSVGSWSRLMQQQGRHRLTSLHPNAQHPYLLLSQTSLNTMAECGPVFNPREILKIAVPQINGGYESSSGHTLTGGSVIPHCPHSVLSGQDQDSKCICVLNHLKQAKSITRTTTKIRILVNIWLCKQHLAPR